MKNEIFSQNIEEGKYYSCLTKKGNKQLINNYWPVLLFPISTKFIEKNLFKLFLNTSTLTMY